MSQGTNLDSPRVSDSLAIRSGLVRAARAVAEFAAGGVAL
jgi:hypothetical protein